MQTFTGVAKDERNSIQKSLDWKAEDILPTSAPYEWKEFDEIDIPQYTIRNQNGSGECGPFSTCKALGINNKPFKNLRPEFIYTKRSNSGAGMWMQDMFDIACKFGSPTDPDLKGDNLTEAQANAYVPTEVEKEEALKYRGKNYLFMSPKNIDAIAQAIDDGYTPILLLRCDISEWTTEPFVNAKFASPFNVNHYVPCIYAGMRNGVKTIVCSDSWGSSFGKNGLRYVSEDFITNRVDTVGYIIDLPDELLPPPFKFNKNLSFGMRNADVLQLQKRLVKEGFATFVPTGYFGPATLASTIKYQLAKGISPPLGFVGSITRGELNK